MIINNKKILVILGGGLLKNKNNKWQTDSFDGGGGDLYGITNSRWRVEAARLLFKDDNSQIIIASGGRGQFKNIPDAPTVSSVIKSELIEFGILPESIIEEDNSNNTLEQLNYLAKIINKNKPLKVTIISNEWALERIRIFIQTDKKLSKTFNRLNTLFVSAENVLISREPKKWKRLVETARKSDYIIDRIKLEKQGVKDIKNKVYGKKDLVNMDKNG